MDRQITIMPTTTSSNISTISSISSIKLSSTISRTGLIILLLLRFLFSTAISCAQIANLIGLTNDLVLTSSILSLRDRVLKTPFLVRTSFQEYPSAIFITERPHFLRQTCLSVSLLHLFVVSAPFIHAIVILRDSLPTGIILSAPLRWLVLSQTNKQTQPSTLGIVYYSGYPSLSLLR